MIIGRKTKSLLLGYRKLRAKDYKYNQKSFIPWASIPIIYY